MSNSRKRTLRLDRRQRFLKKEDAAGGIGLGALIGRLNGDVSPDRRLCLVSQGLEVSEDIPDPDNPIFNEEPEDVESIIEHVADHADEREG